MVYICDAMPKLTNGERVEPEEMKQKFLERYIELGSVKDTCEELCLVRRTIYHWKAQDPVFAENYRVADMVALGILEDEAYRRAVNGVDKPVYQGGKRVGTVKEFSDILLMFLLKARAPHKYKDRVAGGLFDPNGETLELKITHVHSNLPLASSEQDIQHHITDIPHEDLNKPDELSSL